MASIQITQIDPVIMNVAFEGVVDMPCLTAYLEAMTRRLADQRPHAVIFDARRAGRPPALQRRTLADWVARHQLDLQRHCVGNAFIIDSPLVRGALTAMLWLQPLPVPHVVVTTPQEAGVWVRAQLAAAASKLEGLSQLPL